MRLMKDLSRIAASPERAKRGSDMAWSAHR